MKRILTVEEMSGADAAAIAMGIPSLVLMERAALSVVEEILDRKMDLSSVLVLVGPGNNGGDGAAIARLLAEKQFRPEIMLFGNSEKISEQLQVQLKVCDAYGIARVDHFESGRYTLIIDAVFGIGLKRELGGSLAALADRINAEPVPVVAVDIASGIEGNTGHILGTAFKAGLTVTFAAGKTGHYLYPGADYSGEVVVKQIGIPIPDRPESNRIRMIEESDLVLLPERQENGNKGTFGKLLVIAGSAEICGAAYLAAAAALKSGIGMVKIFTHEKNRTALSVLLPEALIQTYGSDSFEKEALRSALEWTDAVLVGPGIGTDACAEAILDALAEYNTHPLVADADALNLIAMGKDPGRLFGGKKAVITPHIGEMSRLTGLTAAQIKADPVTTAREYAQKHQVVCILKDARTVTAYPDGDCYLNTSGCSALATAGSGDVLSGIVSGLMMRYPDTGLPAEAMAVCLHGKLGELAAARKSKASVTAKDLVDLFVFPK